MSANLTLRIREDLDGHMFGKQAQAGIAVAGGTFPANGVLDNFNRTENPASGWTIALQTTVNIQAASTVALSSTSAIAYAAWSAGTFAANQEAYIDMGVAPTGGETFGVLLRFNNLNSGTETGYLVQQTATVIKVWRIDTGLAFAQLGGDISNVPANGDSLGATVIGGTLTVYYKIGAGAWAAVDTRDASAYTGAGYIGIQASDSAFHTIDNFGGGNI